MEFKSCITDKSINKNRINKLEYALSEFQGIFIGVFKINNWYAAATENNRINNRWGLMLKMP